MALHTERKTEIELKQTKEFFDLSTRATQHVFEQVQAGATKAMKPVA